MVGRPGNEARYKVDGTKLENVELFLEFDCYVSSSHSCMLIKQKNYTSNGWPSMTREWKQWRPSCPPLCETNCSWVAVWHCFILDSKTSYPSILIIHPITYFVQIHWHYPITVITNANIISQSTWTTNKILRKVYRCYQECIRTALLILYKVIFVWWGFSELSNNCDSSPALLTYMDNQWIVFHSKKRPRC